MKAILLSAGFGTRLQPLTNTIPKCLVPINGKPLLQIWLEQLSQAGFTEFLINTHYLAEQVRQFIDQSAFKQQITLFHEEQLLGTLGTLKATTDFWQGSEVLIAHADNLCLCSWPDFLSHFHQRPRECMATMMVFNTDAPQSCGIIEMNANQRVIAFHEKVAKPPSNLANAAIYLFSQKVNTVINNCSFAQTDISYHLMPQLLGKMNAWPCDGYLRDIGNLASLTKANEFVRLQWQTG